MFMKVSRTTPTTMSKPEDETRNIPVCELAASKLNAFRIKPSRNGMIATMPRNTAPGKVMRRSPNARHLLSSKSRKQRRRANKSKRVDSGFEKKMLASMPFA